MKAYSLIEKPEPTGLITRGFYGAACTALWPSLALLYLIKAGQCLLHWALNRPVRYSVSGYESSKGCANTQDYVLAHSEAEVIAHIDAEQRRLGRKTYDEMPYTIERSSRWSNCISWNLQVWHQ
nr:hypothetical protein 26 [bacterium]